MIYSEQMKMIGFILFELLLVLFAVWVITKKMKNSKTERVTKNYKVLLKWFDNIMYDKTIDKLLSDRGYHNYAIYGYGELGKILYAEAKKEKFLPSVIIDKNAFGSTDDIDVTVTTVDNWSFKDEVEVVIITALQVINELEDNLRINGYTGDVITLEQLLYEE